MKKLVCYLPLFALLFTTACSSDNKHEDDNSNPVLKTVTIEIERNSEFLSALGESNGFTVSTATVYNKSDWAMVIPNDGKIILYQMDSDLEPKLTLSFKQTKVDLQIINVYTVLDDPQVDPDAIQFDTKVTIKVNGTTVKTETFDFQAHRPNIITYKE